LTFQKYRLADERAGNAGSVPGCESASFWYWKDPKNQSLSFITGPPTCTVVSLNSSR
jgi:hypothetical protein